MPLARVGQDHRLESNILIRGLLQTPVQDRQGPHVTIHRRTVHHGSPPIIRTEKCQVDKASNTCALILTMVVLAADADADTVTARWPLGSSGAVVGSGVDGIVYLRVDLCVVYV